MNNFISFLEQTPFIYERSAAIMIGIGMFCHFLQMGNFAHQNTPWTVAIMLGMIGFAAIALVVSAIVGNMIDMYHFGLLSAGTILILWLWLWYQGLHIDKFLDEKYGAK